MEIICIIPARGGSKSIPQKNIIAFCGKPLIAWSIEQALDSKYVDKVYVTTDDKKIGEISEKYGAKVIWRPAELATDTSSSEDALLHAISIIETQTNIDAVLFLQATSPVRESKDIDEAIEKFLSENADSLFSAAILEDFCVWKLEDNDLKSVTYDYKNRGRRQDREPYYLENGSIYIFKVDTIKKYHNRLGGKIVFYPMPLWKSYEIDTYEDMELCEYYMKNRILYKRSHNLSLKDIKLIVYDFDGVFTDNKVIVREDGMESVTVNRADGMAIGMIKNKGIKQVIFTTETNRVVEARAKKLNIPVIKGLDDKKKTLLSYCEDHEIPLESVVYVGNDINDMEAMKSVGYPVCPADATEEVKKISKIIITVPGGAGVIRELLYYFD